MQIYHNKIKNENHLLSTLEQLEGRKNNINII